MALKMTQTLLVDILKVNKGRQANGLPPLSWEEYAALVENRTPPEILPTLKADIEARARDVAAGVKPFDPRPIDFQQWATPADRPDGTMDAALYAANLETARGLFAAIDEASKVEMFQSLGVSVTPSAGAHDAEAAQVLAMAVTQLGYNLAELASQISPLLPQGAGVDVFRKIQNEIGRTFEHVGAEMKRWSKVPVLKSILGPMGNKIGAEILYQTGRMLHGGSVRDWDERAFVSSLAETLGDIGKGAAIAAPFAPAPWNAVLIAVAAVCTVSTKMMRDHIRQAENKERIAAGLAPLDEAGNEIAPAQAAAAQNLFQGSDGKTYIKDATGRYTLADQNGQPVVFAGNDGRYYYFDGEKQEYYQAQLTGAGCACKSEKQR